jgi:hypothetical protein
MAGGEIEIPFLQILQLPAIIDVKIKAFIL